MLSTISIHRVTFIKSYISDLKQHVTVIFEINIIGILKEYNLTIFSLLFCSIYGHTGYPLTVWSV